MNILLKSASGLALASLFALAHASPPSVNPEQMDLDPDITAKILKEKARQNKSGTPAGNSSGGGGNSSNCGQVNIGNSNSGDKKSISGIGDMFGKTTTVVVTGPVVNTANCK